MSDSDNSSNDSNKDAPEIKTELSQKNDDLKIKLKTIEQILDMYPHLKKDRNAIVNNVLGKKEAKDDDYVLHMVMIGDKKYWRDPFGYILNDELKVVGYCLKVNGDEYRYHFTKKYDIDDLKKKMLKVKTISKQFSL